MKSHNFLGDLDPGSRRMVEAGSTVAAGQLVSLDESGRAWPFGLDPRTIETALLTTLDAMGLVPDESCQRRARRYEDSFRQGFMGKWLSIGGTKKGDHASQRKAYEVGASVRVVFDAMKRKLMQEDILGAKREVVPDQGPK